MLPAGSCRRIGGIPNRCPYTRDMCIQCMAGAMTAGAAATGLRAWLVVRFGPLLTPRRKRVLTAVLLGLGVLVCGVFVPAP